MFGNHSIIFVMSSISLLGSLVCGHHPRTVGFEKRRSFLDPFQEDLVLFVQAPKQFDVAKQVLLILLDDDVNQRMAHISAFNSAPSIFG